jgi:Zn-dependent protease/CBS domain-containing protein
MSFIFCLLHWENRKPNCDRGSEEGASNGATAVAIKLATIYGIPLYIDYSWFIIFALIVWTVGFGSMPALFPALSFTEYLAIGLVSAVLLFVSIVVHELAHSVVAERSGIRIGKITLFLFGGVSEMEEQPSSAGLELRVAAAGPLTSIAIGTACALGWYGSASIWASPLVQAPLLYSSFVNGIVAAFNLIPAFPMDGGRIFRAFLWRSNHNLLKSTRTASRVGRAFAYAMIGGGVVAIFFNPLDGLWFILIGWFISTGASSEMNQLMIQRDLADLKARDIMTSSVDSVPPDLTLEELSTRFHEKRHNGFPVISGVDLIGCVTMHDLRRAKKEQWSALRVQDIMTPKDKLVTAEEADSAQRVLSLMNSNKIGRIFVLDSRSRNLSGIITRSDIIKAIRMQEVSGPREAPGFEGEHLISVEQGMLLEIESPPGEDWGARFDSSDVSLVSERVLQLADGAQVAKRFTFQSQRKGKFTITLTRGPKEYGGKKRDREEVTYTVVVN